MTILAAFSQQLTFWMEATWPKSQHVEEKHRVPKICHFSQECQEEHLNKVHNWHLRLFRGRVWTSLLYTKRRLFATAQEGGCNQEGLELKDLLDCSLFKVKEKWKESKLCIDKLLFLYFVPATSVVIILRASKAWSTSMEHLLFPSLAASESLPSKGESSKNNVLRSGWLKH